MTPAMRPEPHESLYPRWGFLDKFAVNEYMAKSLLVTIVLLAAGQAGVAAFLSLRPETMRLRLNSSPPIDSVVIIDRINVQPPPIAQKERVKIRSKISPPRSGIVNVVKGLVELDNWDATGVPGGTGIEHGIAPIESEGIDAPEIVGVVGGADAWLSYEHEPELISIRQPEYPEIAREAGIEGKVIVRALVGADGFVHAAEVLESVLGLDEAALAAARTAVFRAAQQQGRPVAAWIVIPIEFVLHHR